MSLLFLQGFLIGIAIAAPVGPIGVLCIQRALRQGFKIGWLTGLGAALADGVYGLIAVTGLTAVSSFLIGHQSAIRLFGGVLLLCLGIKLFFTSLPHHLTVKDQEHSSWHAFLTSFGLTLLNPATILSFIAIVAGLGLGSQSSSLAKSLWVVLGITLGSATWWLALSAGVAFVLHRLLNPNMIHWVNRCSGLVIVVFGILALASTF